MASQLLDLDRPQPVPTATSSYLLASHATLLGIAHLDLLFVYSFLRLQPSGALMLRAH